MLGAPAGWFQLQFHPVLSVCRSELRACGEESRCVHNFRLRFMSVWKKEDSPGGKGGVNGAEWPLWPKGGPLGGFALCHLLRFLCRHVLGPAHGKKLGAWVREISSLGFRKSTIFPKVPPPVDREAP